MRPQGNARTPLEAAMRAAGYTQTQLAQRAGLPREQTNKYVSGKLRLGPKNARRFGAALNIAPDTLVVSASNDNGDPLARIDERLTALHELVKANRVLFTNADLGLRREAKEQREIREKAVDRLAALEAAVVASTESTASSLEEVQRILAELIARVERLQDGREPRAGGGAAAR